MDSISLYDFENFIDTAIIEKGGNYFEFETVGEIEEISKNEYFALVSGTGKYSVNIALNSEDELFTHQCSCPYNYGPICKHKVAVLFQIRAHKENDLPFKKGNIHKIREELENYSKNELMQFVVSLAKKDFEIKNKIMSSLDIEVEDKVE